jgi:hypothetical protein
MKFDFCIPEAQGLADLIGAKLDLDSALKYCDLHIEIDVEEPGLDVHELIRRESTRQGLSRAAIVTYGRCWGGGVRKPLPEVLLPRLTPPSRIIHQQVIDIRNKWAAHSVNHFDDVRVYVQVNEGGDESSRISVGVQTQSVAGFRQAFMIPMQKLCQELYQLVQVEIRLESAKVTALARSMKIEEIRLRRCIDGIDFADRQLTTTKVARRFKAQ